MLPSVDADIRAYHFLPMCRDSDNLDTNICRELVNMFHAKNHRTVRNVLRTANCYKQHANGDDIWFKKWRALKSQYCMILERRDKTIICLCPHFWRKSQCPHQVSIRFMLGDPAAKLYSNQQPAKKPKRSDAEDLLDAFEQVITPETDAFKEADPTPVAETDSRESKICIVFL